MLGCVQPDSQKTYLEQGIDMVKGKADNAASAGQPTENKSGTQALADGISGNKNQDQE